ncbi:alpha/beta hydrolase [Pseudanabaena sp. FACHB-2040]|uniref:alpha/beta fold hydrolase n=1 Tax=Pseudanabaena sp. FACHB-2040 TaxID=2692859 RepID=UPI00168600F0|nr:alpha/beta hydrolase [Pseudanabaena sp. FACHB-2040]MBD2258136.1 alpha/beta hydrolase [Pseudanabaena sp. FACHB-2040]
MKISRDPNVRTGRLKLNSGTLFWHEVGQGETLVFLHGTWQDSLQWVPLMQVLSNDFHCIAPDCLGFGESRGNQSHYSIQLQVDTLAVFLQSLRISRCCLVGHSLGAWVAAQFALQYPGLVQRLIVLEPEGLEPTLDRHRWRLHRLLAGCSPFAVVVKACAPLIRLLGGQLWLRRVFALRQQLRACPAACRTVFQRRTAEIKRELVQFQLAQLRMPVALLVSETLTPISEALGKAFIRSLPTTELISLPSDETAWGLALEPTAMALSAFIAETHQRGDPTPTYSPYLADGA